MCAGGGGGGSAPTLNPDLMTQQMGSIEIDPNLGENLNQALAPIEAEVLTDSLSKIPDLTPVTDALQEATEDFFDSGGSLTMLPTAENIPETILDIGDRYDPTDNTGGGFSLDIPTLDEVVDTVSNVTPDIKIIPEDLNTILPDTGDIETITEIAEGATDVLNQANEGIIQPIGENVLGIVEGAGDVVQVSGETVGGITTDILQGDVGTVMQDLNETTGSFLTNPLGTTQEVLDHNLGPDTGLLEALDQTVEFLQDPAGTVEDAIDRGEDFIESIGEETQENVEAYTDVITDIGETAEEIGEAATETYETSMTAVGELAENAANQVTQAEDDLINALVNAGLLSRREPNEDGVGNAQAIMAGDPRMLSLMARRNQARKRGKAQLRKGGGLYIPVGTGLQVPA